MSGSQNRNRDPAKRAAKRARQREARSRSTATTEPQQAMSRSQACHASSGSARKKAREGERLMANERAQRHDQDDEEGTDDQR